MHEKDGIIELTDEEARLANYMPRFPLRYLPQAISDMKQRKEELQSVAEEGWENTNDNHRRPLSVYAFRLGELIDKLERLR